MTCCGLHEIAAALVMALLLGSCAATDRVEPADQDENASAAGPVKRAIRADPAAATAELGDPVDVEFKASVDQSLQRYVKMLPRGFDARKPHDVLIVLHGMGSDRWQCTRDDRGECRGDRDVAARHNLIYISPDYRGPNSGMNSQAEADLLQIIAMLRQEYRVGRVFLAGGSMGGISVLIFAAHHPDLVHGVVSANGKADWAFREPPESTPIGGGQQKASEARNDLPEFTPEKFSMPVAFTVGGKDTVVPPDSVRRLYAKFQQLKKQDVLMIDRPDEGHATNYDDTVASLEFVIRAATEMRRAK